jgi:tRNA threonylcarbamoyladenosine biosynthesis protein TsaE
MRFDLADGRIVLELADLSDTEALGRALARAVGPGRVIGLIGDLGAGKTRLTRAFAEAMDADPGAIASPTFVLIHEYAGRFPIYHFDAYRLAGPDDFDALGAAEYFASGGICVVEWADLVLDRLPADAWIIRLTATGESSRAVSIDGPGIESIAAELLAV